MDEELSKSLLKDEATTALLLEEIANNAKSCAGMLRILGQKCDRDMSGFLDFLFGLEDDSPRKRQRK